MYWLKNSCSKINTNIIIIKISRMTSKKHNTYDGLVQIVPSCKLGNSWEFESRAWGREEWGEGSSSGYQCTKLPFLPGTNPSSVEKLQFWAMGMPKFRRLPKCILFGNYWKWTMVSMVPPINIFTFSLHFSTNRNVYISQLQLVCCIQAESRNFGFKWDFISDLER